MPDDLLPETRQGDDIDRFRVYRLCGGRPRY